MKAFLVLPAFVLPILVLSRMAVANDGADPKKPPDKFKISTKRADDAVEVKADKKKALFIVNSPFGISQAVIERADDRWPETVQLRLNLKGLSHFKASHDKLRLEAAASIEGGKHQVRLWKDGNEEKLLDEKSPLWMKIHILTGAGKPAGELPLKDGYFEMTLPRAFFEGNPRSITLNWIDFYRN